MRTKILTLLVISWIITTWALAYAAENNSGMSIGWMKQRFEKRISSSWSGFSMMWNNHWKWMFQWMEWGKMNKLTDAEKTSLKSMTTAEKQTFLEKKRAEMQAKIEAHEAVIDKLINWETLTDSEKATLAEIKAQRAETKKIREEMQTKMNEIQPILEKKMAWTALTQDEQTKLNDFMLNNNWMWKFKKFGR